MPIDHKEVQLSSGRRAVLERCGDHCHCLRIKSNDRAVWSQCYQEEFDRLWDYAFFVPIVRGRYFADINGDGNLEIAVATWDGGNNIADRYAVIFSIQGNQVVYLGRKKFNLEYGEYLFLEAR